MEPFHQEALNRARPVAEVRDLKPLIDRLSQARIVMLGEATHGTHEFYEWRRLISEWLINKHGFDFVAVEGDWPPCQRVNRYIDDAQAGRVGGSARAALEGFHRWPTWMWSNTETERLVEWLATQGKARFYGLDVYSLFESLHEAIASLARVNPFAARSIRERYACFEPFQRDERRYARSLMRMPEGCEEQVAQALREILRARIETGSETGEDFFDATQNARIVVNAENYYRTMMLGTEDSWNVRDRHMVETLETLLQRHGSESKAVVWAHNTHIGDYRATDMRAEGLVNLGGLAREKWGEEAVALLGFGSYEGSVVASHAWDGPIEKLELPPGKVGSLEARLHEVAQELRSGTFYMDLAETSDGPFAEVIPHRAVGVVYDPRHERRGNYVPTILSRRYDAFFFVDRSTALEPIIIGEDRREIPEAWPSGF